MSTQAGRHANAAYSASGAEVSWPTTAQTSNPATTSAATSIRRRYES